MQVQVVERQPDIKDDYHLKIDGLCSRFGLKEQVEDLLHKLGLRHEITVKDWAIDGGDILAAFVQFEFDEGGHTMQKLTSALLSLENRSVLRNLSRYGLLGFSPGTRDNIGNVWNTMGLKSSFISGPVSFRDIQKDAEVVDLPTPTWLQTVTVASLPAQVYCFGDSATSAVATAGQLSMVPASSWWEAAVLAGKFLVTDRLFPTGSKAVAKKENPRSALKMLYNNIDNVVVELRAIKNNIDNLDAQYRLLEAVSALSLKEAEMLKTCNELSGHYDLSAAINMTDSAHSGVRAATHGLSLCEKVAETTLETGGFSMSLLPLGFTLAYATHAGWTFWEASNSLKRSKHCTQAASLLELTHNATVECTIFLGWISTMSEDFTLSQVQKEGGAHEKRLAERLADFQYDICRDVETKQDISSRAVIQRYIGWKYKQISRLHKKLAAEVDVLYGGNSSNDGLP